MKKLWDKQTELSLATSVFFFAGAVFAGLYLYVFGVHYTINQVLQGISMVGGFVVAVLSFAYGYRVRWPAAAVLMTVTSIVLLVFVGISAQVLYAVNTGLLFFAAMCYLVWFLPHWYARIVVYSWTAMFCVMMVVRFESNVYQLLITMSVTLVALCEMLGKFRSTLEKTSLTDPLTGVWNKRGFARILEREIAVVQRYEDALSVLYLDLNDFKQVNDVHGHAEGDRMLCEFAQMLDAKSRPGDAVCRLGGDEFAIVLPLTDLNEAHIFASRLATKHEQLTWSYGIAQLQHGESLATLVARADSLMLESKLRRRGAQDEVPA